MIATIFAVVITIIIVYILYISVNRKYIEEQKVIKQKEYEKKRIEEERTRIAEENKRKEQEQIAIIKQNIKEGKWIFPAEKFYQLCCANYATALDNDFGFQKARKIAEQLLREYVDGIDLSDCEEYLKKESLESFFEKGKALAEESAVRAKEAEKRKIIAQKQPRNATPTEEQRTFIHRATELWNLYGYDKQVRILTILAGDYDTKIKDLREGQIAMAKAAALIGNIQEKERDWSIVGGIVDGFAGPVAGVVAAANVVAKNQEIRERNAHMRKTSADIMSGIPTLSGDIITLERELEKIKKKLDEVKCKVVLTKPIADEIWENISVGKTTVKKNASGVLSIAVPISLKKPFVLDVPDNIQMVVDGVLKAEVWFEDTCVGTVYFPLPVYGIPCNMTEPYTLDGMCGRFVEYNGEYTVKFADTQNLWIMEDEPIKPQKETSIQKQPSSKTIQLTEDDLAQLMYNGMKKGKGYWIYECGMVHPKLRSKSTTETRHLLTILMNQNKVIRKEENGQAVFWKQ